MHQSDHCGWCSTETLHGWHFQSKKVCSRECPYQQVACSHLAPQNLCNSCWHVREPDLVNSLLKIKTGQRDGQPSSEVTVLKRILVVRDNTLSWCVMRECGPEPLQVNWFRATMRFYNSLTQCNSTTAKQVLHADMATELQGWWLLVFPYYFSHDWSDTRVHVQR